MRQQLVVGSPEVVETEGWLKANLGFNKCQKGKTCQHGVNKKEIQLPLLNRPWKIPRFFNCKSDHVIYILQCTCPKLYVGSTIHMAHVRILQHLRAV